MKKLIKNSIILIIIGLAFNACSNDYVTDGGISTPETELTTYDYLKSHKYHMFDDIVILIDSLNLKDDINNAGTFFAPSDYNLVIYLEEKTKELQEASTDPDAVIIYTFEDLLNDPETTPEMILQYAFNEKLSLADAALTDDVYTNLAGKDVIVKKIKTDDSQYYQYSDEPVYFMYYIKPDEIIRKDGALQKVVYETERSQTSDILTQNGNGTVLHVMPNGHIFNSFKVKSTTKI